MRAATARPSQRCRIFNQTLLKEREKEKEKKIDDSNDHMPRFIRSKTPLFTRVRKQCKDHSLKRYSSGYQINRSSIMQ